MEKFTSSIYVVMATLGKRVNEGTISSEGPSKRTRQSSRKESLIDAASLATYSIQDMAKIGKEAMKMITKFQ